MDDPHVGTEVGWFWKGRLGSCVEGWGVVVEREGGVGIGIYMAGLEGCLPWWVDGPRPYQ